MDNLDPAQKSPNIWNPAPDSVCLSGLWSSAINLENLKQNEAVSNIPERYQRLTYIGEGATAFVFKAFDTLLQRWIALKILKSKSESFLESVLEEARAQAQLEHPNLCRIYEAGHGYIAMELAEGPTLRFCAQNMDLTTLIQIIRDLAEGIHLAHRHGLVHLDIKPGNILMQQSERALWRGILSDFGMMRNADKKDITTCPLGTPPFSSPEQVRGDLADVDRRSDIYSLGVTLYFLLAGQSPFATQSIKEMLTAIQHWPPTPLRRHKADIHKDLEAIINKCMAKDPEKRYDTAMDLAMDLDRFLTGCPVHARPLDPIRRCLLAIHRSPKVSIAIISAITITLASTGAWLWRDYSHKAQTLWVQKFSQETIRMEGILRSGRMLPLHDTRRERSYLQKKIRDIQDELSNHSAAIGPGHWALGQAYLLTGDFKQAQSHLHQAIASGFYSPAVHQTLGEAMLLQYSSELQTLGTIEDPKLRKRQRETLETTIRQPALRHLSIGNTNQDLSIHKARLALAENRTSDAELFAINILIQEPWNYEPIIDVAEAKTLAGLTFLERGEKQNARIAFKSALELLERPSRIAPSDERIYFLKSRIWYLAYDIELNSESKTSALDKSIEWIDLGLKSRPDDIGQICQKALLYTVKGKVAIESKASPNIHLNHSIQICNQIIDNVKTPEHRAKIHHILGWNNYQLASAQTTCSAGEPFYRQAIADFQKAVLTGKADWNTYRTLALALTYMAFLRDAKTGKDPFPMLSQAESCINTAIELYPISHLHYVAAWICHQKAYLLFKQGDNPSEALNSSKKHITKGLEINVNDENLYKMQSINERIEALYAASKNQDPTSIFQNSLQSLEKAKALGLRPNNYWRFRIDHLESYAQALLDRFADPSMVLETLKTAIQASNASLNNKTLAQNFNYEHLLSRTSILKGAHGSFPPIAPIVPSCQSEEYCNALFHHAWFLLAHGNDASLPIRQIETELKKRKTIEPCEINNHFIQSHLSLINAAIAWKSKKDTTQAFQEIDRELTKALKRQPSNPNIYYLNAAKTLLQTIIQRESISELTNTIRSLEKGIQQNPGDQKSKYLLSIFQKKTLKKEQIKELTSIDPMLLNLYKWKSKNG